MSENEQIESTRKELPIKIKLDKPVYTGEEEITELVIKREPTGGDWSGFNIQNSTISDFQRIASKLSGIALPVIKKIDTKATFELVQVISDFLD